MSSEESLESKIDIEQKPEYAEIASPPARHRRSKSELLQEVEPLVQSRHSGEGRGAKIKEYEKY